MSPHLCTVLCYDMSACPAMLCRAVLCMLCYAMLCYAMLCYAMLCYAMLCYAMLAEHHLYAPHRKLDTGSGALLYVESTQLLNAIW